jgi:hypothetical protein
VTARFYGLAILVSCVVGCLSHRYERNAPGETDVQIPPRRAMIAFRTVRGILVITWSAYRVEQSSAAVFRWAMLGRVGAATALDSKPVSCTELRSEASRLPHSAGRGRTFHSA